MKIHVFWLWQEIMFDVWFAGSFNFFKRSFLWVIYIHIFAKKDELFIVRYFLFIIFLKNIQKLGSIILLFYFLGCILDLFLFVCLLGFFNFIFKEGINNQDIVYFCFKKSREIICLFSNLLASKTFENKTFGRSKTSWKWSCYHLNLWKWSNPTTSHHWILCWSKKNWKWKWKFFDYLKMILGKCYFNGSKFRDFNCIESSQIRWWFSCRSWTSLSFQIFSKNASTRSLNFYNTKTP